MTSDRYTSKAGEIKVNPRKVRQELPGDYSFAFTGEIRGLVDNNGKPIVFRKSKKK